MAQTAPMPAGFPPATLDADTLPPSGSPADREPVRRPLPQSGYLTASPAALRALAEGEEQTRRMGRDAAGRPVIRHAAAIAAGVAEREAAAEAERKARNVRAVWRQSLALESEALANVDRLAPLVQRAGELVRSLESRQRENAATVAAGDEAAAARLIEALAAGETAAPAPSQVDVAEAEALAAELKTARGALRQLASQMTAAADRLDRCRAGVSRCAYAVLVDEAADLAGEILAAAAELETRRADLHAPGDAAERRASPAKRVPRATARRDQPGTVSAGRATCRPDPCALAGRLARPIRPIAARRESPGRNRPARGSRDSSRNRRGRGDLRSSSIGVASRPCIGHGRGRGAGNLTAP